MHTPACVTSSGHDKALRRLVAQRRAELKAESVLLKQPWSAHEGETHSEGSQDEKGGVRTSQANTDERKSLISLLIFLK